ncbi:MAG: hypothetical protein QM766_09920 [Burkholderiaceae bacterium]
MNVSDALEESVAQLYARPRAEHAAPFETMQALGLVGAWAGGDPDASERPKREPRPSGRGQARQAGSGTESAPGSWRGSSRLQAGVTHFHTYRFKHRKPFRNLLLG